MAAGVTSDATEIMIFDDTNANAGGDGSYSFADIFAVLGGTGVDILRVDSGTGFPTYRLLKNLQIGDKTATVAATTLLDTNVVATFDDGKVLKTRSTQTTSWSCLFGTKIGSGNTASGKKGVHLYFSNSAGTNTIIVRGTVKWYGCSVRSTWAAGAQAFQMPLMTSGASELVNCTLGGFSGYVLGSSGANISNLFNVDITGDPTVTTITSFFVDSASRVTVGGSPVAGSYVASNFSGLQFKDSVFSGTPAVSDLNPSAGAQSWLIVRPTWSGNANKFSTTIPATAATGAHEYWLYNVKIADSVGTPIAGIPVKLTDTIGTVQVNGTTDSNGRVSFGSGLTANAVVVMDHYQVASVYTQLHRSPFLVEINTGAGANSS